MIRTLRLALVAVAVVAIAGLAYAGPDCNKNSAANSSCGAKTTAVKADAASADCAAACAAAGKTCTAAEKAACAEKANMANAGSGCPAQGEAAMAECSYCNLMRELHDSAGKVKLSAQETENGVVVVFAAVSQDDLSQAHAVAAKAYDMMTKPAACTVTKAKMASTTCEGCKEGLNAFANSKVTMEETADGDKAMVSADDEQTVEQLHAFFRNLQAHATQG